MNESIEGMDERFAADEPTTAAPFDDPRRQRSSIDEDDLRALTERIEERTAELRRVRGLFHHLFHASPVPMIILRLDDGTCVDANEAYLDLFADRPGRFMDPAALERRLWPDGGQRARLLEEVRRSGRVRNVEIALRTESGKPKTILAFLERVEHEEETHLISVYVDITGRKRAEEKIRSLASGLILAEQEERRRVAEALHGDLQQRLYGIKYKLAAIREAAERESAPPLDALRMVEGWLDGSIAATRQLTVDLSPPVLKEEGLTDALGWLVTQMKQRYDLDVSLTSDKTHKVRNPDVRLLLFQVVRELLFNVVKHAGVHQASLHVSERDGVWMIDVADEGCGFDPRAVQTGSESGGFGLQNARERLRLFGGEIEIDATPAEGTRVTVRMPFPPARTTRASREGRKRRESTGDGEAT